MRTALKRTGLVLLVAGSTIWLIGGARKGFYVVTEEIAHYDLITDIHYTDNRPKFLPGIETLALAAILGGSFWLCSFLCSNPLKQDNTSGQ